MSDRTRYRLKILVPASGVFGAVLKVFPNSLTFVGYPSTDQLAAIQMVNQVLGSFGVSIDVAAA